MPRSLSSQHNLEDVKKEARELLHGLRRSDVGALRRHSSLDGDAGRTSPRLADAQYIVAREYGYSSWQKLKQRLENNFTEMSERMASALRDRYR
jgi:hypothetical protein